ncbi:MAG: hypothetical protein ACRDOK_26775 [Streptosporangiaceae bacterium]
MTPCWAPAVTRRLISAFAMLRPKPAGQADGPVAAVGELTA